MALQRGRRYRKKGWTSLKVISLTFILLELLVKEPSKRLTLKEVLQHSWITRDIKDIREARRNSLPGNAFELFSLAKPEGGDLFKEMHKKPAKE